MFGFLSHLKPEQNSEILQASCGPIRGNVYRHDTKLVDGYLGIPYAQPPIGNLRYKKSEPMKKWAEPRDCYQYGPGCPQSGWLAKFLPENGFKEDEDNCLTLNVFAPQFECSEFPKGLPVMVYIHGGGFETGCSAMFDDYSISGTLPLQNIVLVTINYRVGPLGFLTIDDVAKGNYGLWDQTLALRWVQQHIHSFGGDNHNVTIFGTSAGGASVDLLALSPHSNQLFHRFVAMSGTAYCNFAITMKEIAVNVHENFAKHHGFEADGAGARAQELLSWYQATPISKFKDVSDWKLPCSGFIGFMPNFDGDFFPKPLEELRREAPTMEVMTTVTEFEGLLMYNQNPKFQNPENFLDIIADYYGPDVTDDYESVQKEIFDFYTKNIEESDSESEELKKKVIEFFSDTTHNIPALNMLESCAKLGNPTFFALIKDAYHGSELKYILGTSSEKFEPTEEELMVMDTIQGYLANFARSGNPNEEGKKDWEKYYLAFPHRYFQIKPSYCEMKDSSGFKSEVLEMYNNINRGSGKYLMIFHRKPE